MARFVIIDNWLDSVGGHNYQYAVEILQAAAATGRQPLLATARSFHGRNTLPDDWQIRPLFRYTWNRTHTVGGNGKRNQAIDLNGRRLPCPTANGSLNRLIAPAVACLDLIRQRNRRRRIEAFRSACAQLFDEIGLCPEDLIFLPSVSDFDLLGLVSFLAANPSSRAVDWHVQFHFDIFDGRPPDYVTQRRRRELLQRQFSNALGEIPGHRLHFYATTPQIASQYNQLQVGDFRPLPYPVNGSSFRLSTSRGHAKKPLRVTMAGAARREKGKHGLADLIDQIRGRDQLGKKVQLWIQGNPGRIRKSLPKLPANSVIQGHVDSTYDEAIVVVEHPLGRDDYVALIRQSQIAIFPYSNASYHARASGVLVEMLAAGVAVIVPAGSWLAAQISDSIYAYLTDLRADISDDCRILEPQSAHAEDPQANTQPADDGKGRFCFGGANRPAIAEIPVTEDTDEMILSFQWSESRPGYFVRLRVEQTDADGARLTDPWETILGKRKTDGPVSALVHLNPRAHGVRITFENAYHHDLLRMSRPEICFFRGPPGGSPAGAIGLVTTDAAQIPDLLAEMVRHYDHYHRTAAEFATTWKKNHAPIRTVTILAANLPQAT